MTVDPDGLFIAILLFVGLSYLTGYCVGYISGQTALKRKQHKEQ
jgi:hypothetical protein